MKAFTYTINDPLGIHARPAGMLAKAAKNFADTTVTVSKNGNAVKATQLMKLMGLGIKQGDVVTVAADGPSEDAAIAAEEACKARVTAQIAVCESYAPAAVPRLEQALVSRRGNTVLLVVGDPDILSTLKDLH